MAGITKKTTGILTEIAAALWRCKCAILLCALVASAVYFAQNLLFPAAYRAQTTIDMASLFAMSDKESRGGKEDLRITYPEPAVVTDKTFRFSEPGEGFQEGVEVKVFTGTHNKISAQGPGEDVTFKVTVTSDDPDTAQRVCRVWAEEFIRQCKAESRESAQEKLNAVNRRISSTRQRITKIEQQLAALRREYSLAATSGWVEEQKDNLRKAQEEVTEISRQLDEKTKLYKETDPRVIALRADFTAAQKKLVDKEKMFARARDKAKEYHALQRQTGDYRLLENKLKQNAGALNNTISIYAQAMDPAAGGAAFTLSVGPAQKINPAFAVITGLFCGALCCFVSERKRAVVRDKGDICLQGAAAFLGSIPYVRRQPGKTRDIFKFSAGAKGAFEDIAVNAEKQQEGEKQCLSVMITSALPQEGKTFVAVQLAAAFALSRKTLLIDGDMRRGGATGYFGLNNEKGLSSVVDGSSTLEETAVKTAYSNLYVMPRGPCLTAPAEVMTPNVLGELLGSAQKEFSVIIVDTPSVLSVTDPLVLSEKCDRVILVVRAGFTESRYIFQAQTMLVRRTQCLGVVLNRAKTTGFCRQFFGISLFKRQHNDSVPSAVSFRPAKNAK